MHISREQFERNLFESQLMTATELAEFEQQLPPERRQADAETLTRELVQAKRLTKYQAARIYQGKPKQLRLGDYDVLQFIASGGMGRVYKALKRSLQKEVALKILHPHLLESEAAIKRFRREVKVAARLQHRNIVMALDADSDNGCLFMAMEYVDGRDLAALLKIRGPMSVEQAVDCITQAAQGMAYAHAAGIVHRDIKPANLMLDRSGNIKILDLGLALLIDAPDDSTELTLQRENKVAGTFDYMSPEQAVSSASADVRSDIYSLGCTLYTLLTGKVPFGGSTPLEKVAAHRDSPIPSLHSQRNDVPDHLEAIYRRMMAKLPSGRPRTMQEVLQSLQGDAEIIEALQVHDDSALSLFFTDEQMAAIAINEEEPWKEDNGAAQQKQRGPWKSKPSADSAPPPYEWPQIDISLATLILFGVCGVVAVLAIALLLAIAFA